MPAGFDDFKKFSIPLDKVAVEDSTAYRLLELVGERLAVRYMETQYAQSPCFQYLVREGEIETLEPSWGGDAAKRALQLEAVNAQLTYSASSDPKSIAISATSDPGPLQRAEWIEFVSLFFNKEGEANSLFEGIRDRYICHRKQVAEYKSKPVVAWVYNSSWGGNWVVSNSEFKHYYLRDAGATVLGTAGVDMTFTTAAELHAALANVDILIDETYSLSEYTFQQFLQDYNLDASSPLKFVQNKAVWRLDKLVNPQNAQDWFAGAVVEADVVLEDLMSVIQPSHQNKHERVWLRHLVDERPHVQDYSTCVNPLAAEPVIGDECKQVSCVVEYDSATDYFPHKARANHAEDWNVTYHGSYKVVHNKRANEKYLLYQCGTPMPAGFDDFKKFSIPLDKVAVEDSTAYRLLELVGERLAVRYMETQYAQSPCFQYLVREGEIETLEPSWGGDAAKRALQLEAVNAQLTYSASSDPKSIAISATSDPGPLQRAEWIEFVSLFFNKEGEANSLFEGIRDRYICHRKQVAEYKSKPVVAWVYNSSWGGNWVVSNSEFKHYYLRDAGATVLGTAGVDMTFTTAAELHAALANVDILIDETYSLSEYTFQQFLQDYNLDASSPLKFVQNKAVWRLDKLVNPQNAQDWFAGAVVEADVVLEDLMSVIQPSHQNKHERVWLRHLVDERPHVQDHSTCVNPLSAPPPLGDICSALVSVAAGSFSVPPDMTNVSTMQLGPVVQSSQEIGTVTLEGSGTELAVTDQFLAAHVSVLTVDRLRLRLSGPTNHLNVSTLQLSNASLLAVTGGASVALGAGLTVTGTGELQNAGTVTLSQGVVSMETRFNNTGRTEVADSELQLRAPMENGGTIHLGPQGRLACLSAVTVTAAGSVTGTGHLRVLTSGALQVSGGSVGVDVSTATSGAPARQKLRVLDAAGPTLSGWGAVAKTLTLAVGQLQVRMDAVAPMTISRDIIVGGAASLGYTEASPSASSWVKAQSLSVSGPVQISVSLSGSYQAKSGDHIKLIEVTSGGLDASAFTVAVSPSGSLTGNLIVKDSQFLALQFTAPNLAGATTEVPEDGIGTGMIALIVLLSVAGAILITGVLVAVMIHCGASKRAKEPASVSSRPSSTQTLISAAGPTHSHSLQGGYQDQPPSHAGQQAPPCQSSNTRPRLQTDQHEACHF